MISWNTKRRPKFKRISWGNELISTNEIFRKGIKMKLRKMMFNLGFVFLALVFALGTIGATSQTVKNKDTVSQFSVSNYLEAQKNDNLSDEEKIKSAINAYFTLRYESQKELKEQDFSILIEDNTLNWVKTEKDRRYLDTYIASLYNTSYKSYSFSIDYDSININEKEAVVKLRESNEVVISTGQEPSKMGNLPHTFTLHNKGGIWLIYADEYQDDISVGIKDKTIDELIKQVDENYQLSKQSYSTSSRSVLVSFMARPARLSYNTYNRTAAKNYADTYWNTVSPPYYLGLGSDCTNFVSQAIYAGEGKTPPDTGGMATSSTRSYYNDWY
jgi:hypothetical protein